MEEFNGIKYYGTLITPEEAKDMESDIGYYPLSTNNLQGTKAEEFINKLSSIKGIKILLDLEDHLDRADTVIIYDINIDINEISNLIEIIGSARPDECNKFENNTIRLWWD